MKRTIKNNTDRAFKRAFNLESFEHLEEGYEEGLEDYEEGYEELEEQYENLRRAGHRNPHAAMKAKHGSRWKGKVATKKSHNTLVGATGTGAEATFTVNVKRLTFNIATDLPVEVFNVIDNYSDNAVLRRYLPAVS